MLDPYESVRRHGDETTRVAIAMTVITTVAVILRLIARYHTKFGFGTDDAIIITSQVLWFVLIGVQIYGVKQGQEATSDADEGMVEYVKSTYIMSFFYCAVVFCTNVSTLVWYLRLFSVQKMRRLTWALLGLHVLWFIPAIISVALVCTPVDVLWNHPEEFATKCIDFSIYLVLICTFELVLDVLVIALPVTEVLKLNMSRTMRALVAGIFALAGFSILSGILRITFVYKKGQRMVDLNADEFWFDIHLGTAIVSSCLPTYRPLISLGSSYLSRQVGKVSKIISSKASSTETSHSGQLPYTSQSSGFRKHTPQNSDSEVLLAGQHIDLVTNPKKTALATISTPGEYALRR